MILADLGRILCRDEAVWLWYCGEFRYRGRFSEVPRIFLNYPVDLIKPVDNKLHIYLF